MISTPLRALILDYGEVLSYPMSPGAFPEMAALLSAPADRVAEAYWRHRREYDMALPVEEYWHRVIADLDVSAPADRIAALIDLDVRAWTRYREETWTLAGRARRQGIRTGVLSNGVREIVEVIEAQRGWSSCFDTLVVSCEVGCAKPGPEIYRLTLERLGVEPAEALFVDDRAENIAAAQALGLQTLHFTGDNSVELLEKRLD